MKKINKFLKILYTTVFLLLVIFYVLSLVFEVLGVVFFEEFCYQLGILHPLRFIGIVGVILISSSLILEWILNKLN